MNYKESISGDNSFQLILINASARIASRFFALDKKRIKYANYFQNYSLSFFIYIKNLLLFKIIYRLKFVFCSKIFNLMTAILVFSFVDFIAVIFTPSSSRLATFFVLASVLVSLNQESVKEYWFSKIKFNNFLFLLIFFHYFFLRTGISKVKICKKN